MDKFTQINLVLKDYFDLNKSVKTIAIKDMMPYFVLAGIFKNDNDKGLPIRNLIKKLDVANNLKVIPYLNCERKEVYTKWFFESGNHSVFEIVKIQNKIAAKKIKAKKLKAKNTTKKKIVKK